MSGEHTIDNAINNEVYDLLNVIAKKHNIKKFYLEVNEGSTKGDGCTSIRKSVKMINADDLNEILCLFVKSSPREENVRDLCPMAELFKTEIHMYDTIFPKFKDLEVQNGLNQTIFMPNFFGSLFNDKNEVIILENLKEYGYRLHDRKTPMDSEHTRMAVTAYAKFHSLSFALRNQQPEMFENLQPKLYNFFPKLIDDLKSIVINKYTEMLNILPEDDSKKIRNFLQDFERELKELLNIPIDEYSVILHGDCWVNNIMFKYLDDSCSPTNVCFIDYQMSRLAPPVLDLVYFFFTCSSEEEINRCDEYLDLYYTTLSTHLKNLNCDPNKLYPYSIFMKQWNMFAKFSIIMSPLAFLVMLRIENKIVDLGKSADTGLTLSEAFNHDTKNNKEYSKRLGIIISYLVKNNLL